MITQSPAGRMLPLMAGKNTDRWLTERERRQRQVEVNRKYGVTEEESK